MDRNGIDGDITDFTIHLIVDRRRLQKAAHVEGGERCRLTPSSSELRIDEPMMDEQHVLNHAVIEIVRSVLFSPVRLLANRDAP